MEDDKTLLHITREEDGVASHWRGHGLDDLLAVCLSIADFARRNPTFMLMLLGTLKETTCNEEFSKELEDSSIEMPDFEALLKDDKNA